MKAFPAPGAPEGANGVISDYWARWFAFFGPLVICLLLLPLMWALPLVDHGDVVLVRWVTGGAALYLAVWWVAVWWVPTRKYRRYKADGSIIEVTNPEIIAYAKGFRGPIDRHVAALYEAELKRFYVTIAELNLHASADPDFVRQKIAEEKERLANLKTT